MIVGQSSVDLRKREVPELLDNFLGHEPGLVPQRDSTHRYTCACNAWTPPLNAFMPLNQAADLCDRRHRSDYIDCFSTRRSPFVVCL